MPSATRLILHALGLALAYYAAGRVGLLVSVYPSHASGFWPASGVALGALLVFSPRLWPGIWVGAFVLMFHALRPDPAAAGPLAVALPAAAIATGATLQALGAAALIRRAVGDNLELIHGRDALRFSLIAGPLASLIGASVGSATLLAAGLVAGRDVGHTFLTWWIGDAIGLGGVTPLMLVWKGEPRAVWRRRVASVAVPLATTMGILLALFLWIGRLDERHVRAEFAREAESVTRSIATSFGGAMRVLYSLGDFVAAAEDGDRADAFSPFARRALANNPEIQALSWNPRVPAGERAAFEQGAGGVRIVERDGAGRLVAAAPRAAHVVVWHIEPLESNAAARGFDVASESARADALRRACASGEPAATGRITLVQDRAAPGMLAFVPVLARGLTAAGADCSGVRGFATAVFRIDTVMRTALATVGEHRLDVALVDRSAPAPDTLWTTAAGAAARPAAAGTLTHTAPLRVGGRTWSIETTSTPAYVEMLQSWRPWVVLFAGTIFTTSLSGFLLVVTGKAVVIERIGARRTTELQHAYDRVLASERRLQTIIEAEPACVKLVSADGRLLEMNRAGLAMVGAKDVSRVAGKRVVELIHPEDRERFLAMHHAAGAGTPGRIEFRLMTLDGGERWVDSHAVAFDAAGAPPGAVLSVTADITERKQLEEQLRQSQRMEAVGRLAGGIAHDFNNLLTVIQGFSTLVLDRSRDRPQVAADVEQIAAAADRAAQLTRQLLAFSRKQLLAPQVIDLNERLGSFEKMVRRIISEAVTLEIRPAPALARTKADPSQIEQLLMNVVVNACDAMPQGGTLTITTANVVLDEAFVRRHAGSAPGPHVALTVTDTGHGMSAAVLARVFEPFFTTKEQGKGTGLGMATVYGIVQQSGGCLTIDSAPGQGTRVAVYLPAASEAPGRAAVDEPPPAAHTGSETILLVEDEGSVRSLMRRVLERHGYTVLQAQDASEALPIEQGHAAPIHLLISDVIMPGLSGPDLAQRIVQRRPDIRVLFVSGHTAGRVVDLGVSSRRAAFLQKPFRAESLVSTVRACLDGPRPAGDA